MRPVPPECIAPASAPLSTFTSILEKQGACLIRGLLDKETAERIRMEGEPYLKKDNEDGEWKGEFFPATTKKVGGMITKSPTLATKFLTHPTLTSISHHFLSRRHLTRIVTPRKWSTSMPQVNVSAFMETWPGAEHQCLHRDDGTFHNLLPHAEEYYHGRDVSTMNFLALSKVTPDNGGTLFVPGSHLLGEDETPPGYDDACASDMEPGDALIILSSVYHGGGSNIMPPGSENSVRAIALVGFCLGILRQEENQYLALDHQILKTLPLEVQKLCGWDVSLPMLGWVDFGSPLHQLGVEVEDGDNLFYDEDQGEEPHEGDGDEKVGKQYR